MAMIAPDPICEDLAYSPQFFSLTQQGHTRPTAEFGAPAMIWHVSFWPRRQYDPHDLDMTDTDKSNSTPGLKDTGQILDEHCKRFAKVTEDFNDFLKRLQKRAWLPNAQLGATDFTHERPVCWDGKKSDELFHQFSTNAHGFTLWWADPANIPTDSDANMIGSDPAARPRPSDIRVRVQTEVAEDFFSITFYIDAGKPWEAAPVCSVKEAMQRGVSGVRRAKIFKHVDAIKSISEARLKRSTDGRALVDLPLLPERIINTPPQGDENDPKWLADEKEAGKTLLDAAEYLYDRIWDDFCRDFNFNLCDIAGETDEVFANFRGLVLSTAGVTEPTATSPGIETADCGLSPFPRFEASGDRSGYGSSVTEPNAVVKAFMPFMRRFRSQADWRDWIACGIFDWRAIYITPLGSRSEFRAFDDGDKQTIFPADNLPKRLKRDGEADNPELNPICATYAEGSKTEGRLQPEWRFAPTTAQKDRPAPFRYLLLTKHEPNRIQVGRIVERINTTGVNRLYAIKNWSVLLQAGEWVRTYGQQLDAAYKLWIADETKIREEREKHDRVFIAKLKMEVARLRDWRTRKEAEEAFSDVLDSPDSIIAASNVPDSPDSIVAASDFPDSPDSIIAALINCKRKRYLSKTRQSSFMSINLNNSDTDTWERIFTHYNEFRAAKEGFDKRFAQCNVAAENKLVTITSQLDKLGRAAIGGLSYRVSRSRYYANLYRSTLPSLRTGNIETWWSYEQFAKRGMEPALRFIENLGDRLEKLRERLQSVKNDILQSSINHQTEATRDNTHKLERIQDSLSHISETTALAEKRAAQTNTIYTILLIFIAIANFVIALPPFTAWIGFILRN